MRMSSLSVLRRLLVVEHHLRQVRACNLSTNSVLIELSSNNVLIDEKVRITVKGLEQGQRITLHTRMKELEKVFGACGHYVADGQGKVDTFLHSSHGGTFTGVESMGLFWSMKTAPGVKPGRLLKSDVMSPYDTNVAVQEGHVGFDALDWSENPPSLASIKLKRSYVSPGVRRIPVSENGIYGTLFIPPGTGPFPAVYDIFGMTGGITEHRSALLASRGFASFAIAYVNYKDLPKNELELDRSYFLKAFDWFAAHPEVDSNAIGGVATCVGVSYAFLIAAMRPSVRCLVSINGYGNPIGKDQVIEEELIPANFFKFDRIRVVDGRAVFRHMLELESEIQPAPGWRHGAKIFFIHGEDDQCVNPLYLHCMKEQIPKEFKENMAYTFYPGAGHLLEPPYAPLCRYNWNSIFKMNLLWGGQHKLHTDAQEDFWPKMLDFLNKNLPKSSGNRIAATA